MKRSYLIGILLFLLVIGIFAWNNLYTDNRIAKKPGFDLAGGPEKQERGFPQREIIDLASEYPNIFFRQGPKVKKVALTFDDGPDNNFTVKILDVLKRHKVPATFFVIGKRCELYPNVVRRMVKEGHILANHTYTHPNIIKVSNQKALAELTKTDNIIKKYADYSPAFFRSPYGALDRSKLKIINDKGYKIIAWNVDSLDWKGLSAAEVKTNVLENIQEGSIILQHSAGGVGEDLTGTVQALDDIIRVLKKDGFQFVTVDKLLNIPFKK